MDQGFIRSLKHITEGELCICYAEPWKKNETHPKISTLQAMKALAGSCETVTKETVNNYSKKACIKGNHLSLLI